MAAGLPRRGWALRLATEADVPALAELIPESVRALQAGFYSEAQREAAIGDVFDVDRQLVGDRTYFVAEGDGRIVGCGGWSRRRRLTGGGDGGDNEARPLDPARDPARLRAFFIRPGWERQGIGRALIVASERAIREAGFTTVILSATLAGVPLYAAMGYRAGERTEAPLRGGLTLPVVAMDKDLSGAVEPGQQPPA
jgi:GNAT superfamily N-acetyltransferase